MSDAILEITDGTTTISLINPSSGFHMIRWVPGITDYKGGGVFTDPPLADWRQLRVGKWDTVQEQFGLTIDAANPNNAAYALQELRRLLEKANAYWTTDWQSTPVYLVAKAKCETETRYCLIVKGRLANDQNYYQQPFTGKRSTMQDLPLIIERRAWLSSPPGQGDDIAISASEDYDGRTYGVATATNAAETVIISGGKRIEANLTDVYLFDDTGASFSSNLLDAALPQFLLPASTTVDDAIYFIIDTSLSDSGPFDNVVFNISQAASSTGTYDGTWEYWNGAAWAAFPAGEFVDGTESGSNGPFSQTGIVSLTFEQEADWVTTTVNGITGYAIRMRVSTLTGTFTRPQQSTRMIYSAIWPYVEMNNTTIPGDIFALSQIRLRPYGQQPGQSGFTYTPEIFVGLRSTDRGANFTPYINTVNEQNPSGITVAAFNGASFVDNIRSPTGRVLEYSPAGFSNVIERIRITFSDALAPEYVGKFRCFLVMDGDFSATFTYRLKVRSSSGVTVFTSDSVNQLGVTTSPFFYTYIDFGEVNLGAFAGNIKNSSESSSFIISIEIGNDVAGTTRIPYLLLMPIDEWSGKFTADGSLSSVSLGNKSFLFDSVEFPKKPARALIHNSNEIVVGNIRTTINGPVILQANKTQRYYFFVSDITTSSLPQVATTYVMAVQINRVARYLSLRGER